MQIHRMLSGIGLVLFDGRRQQRPEFKPVQVKRHFAGHELVHVQQVIDQT